MVLHLLLRAVVHATEHAAAEGAAAGVRAANYGQVVHATRQLKAGSVYVGDWMIGIGPHGMGRITLKSGGVYEGRLLHEPCTVFMSAHPHGVMLLLSQGSGAMARSTAAAHSHTARGTAANGTQLTQRAPPSSQIAPPAFSSIPPASVMWTSRKERAPSATMTRTC